MNFKHINTINALIARLYNEELPTQSRILGFFHSMLSLVYFDCGTIFFFYIDECDKFQKHSSISLNWEKCAESIKKYDKYYCNMDDTLPTLSQSEPIIFRGSSFFDHKKRKETTYWKEYLSENDCIYSIDGNLQLSNGNHLKGGFAFYRGGNKSDFTDEEVDLISLFQPHLSNILKYYGQPAENKTSSVSFYLQNYKSIGFAIYDSKYQIVQSSELYHNIMNKYDAFHISDKITSLIFKLTKENSEAASVIEYKYEDVPVYVEIRKYVNTSSTSAVNSQYGCMIYDLSIISNQTLEQIRTKYHLKITEFNILKALLDGCSNEEISEMLFISLPTTKKYITSLYSKLEINNQKQLLKKLKIFN